MPSAIFGDEASAARELNAEMGTATVPTMTFRSDQHFPLTLGCIVS